MTAPGNTALLVSLLALVVACTAYAVGRVHQRREMAKDREEAYRDGYDTATRDAFSLAARVIGPRSAARAPASGAGAAAGGSAGVSSGRHTVPEELVRAATYRLPPDRVFRAKVQDPASGPPGEPSTWPPVPKPR